MSDISRTTPIADQRRELLDGNHVPLVGFGTLVWPDDKVSPAPYQQATEQALANGYRLLDTALRYENEKEVGAALRASGLPRDQVQITTKIPGRYHGYDEARISIETSLSDLGVDYVDFALIHWPLPKVGKYVDTWKSMIKMKEEGLIRTIGVSNFLPEYILRLDAETGVMPAINQVEMHPYFPQGNLRAFHAEHNIQTESWSPLGRGSDIIQEPVINRIAGERGVKPAKVVLRWHLQHKSVPIPSSKDDKRQQENLALNFTLSDRDMADIDKLERGRIWDMHPAEHEEF